MVPKTATANMARRHKAGNHLHQVSVVLLVDLLLLLHQGCTINPPSHHHLSAVNMARNTRQPLRIPKTVIVPVVVTVMPEAVLPKVTIVIEQWVLDAKISHCHIGLHKIHSSMDV
jgi:hypothetical protein